MGAYLLIQCRGVEQNHTKSHQNSDNAPHDVYDFFVFFVEHKKFVRNMSQIVYRVKYTGENVLYLLYHIRHIFLCVISSKKRRYKKEYTQKEC